MTRHNGHVISPPQLSPTEADLAQPKLIPGDLVWFCDFSTLRLVSGCVMSIAPISEVFHVLWQDGTETYHNMHLRYQMKYEYCQARLSGFSLFDATTL